MVKITRSGEHRSTSREGPCAQPDTGHGHRDHHRRGDSQRRTRRERGTPRGVRHGGGGSRSRSRCGQRGHRSDKSVRSNPRYRRLKSPVTCMSLSEPCMGLAKRVLDPVEVVFADDEQRAWRRRRRYAHARPRRRATHLCTHMKLLCAVTPLLGGVTAHNNEKLTLGAGRTG